MSNEIWEWIRFSIRSDHWMNFEWFCWFSSILYWLNLDLLNSCAFRGIRNIYKNDIVLIAQYFSENLYVNWTEKPNISAIKLWFTQVIIAVYWLTLSIYRYFVCRLPFFYQGVCLKYDLIYKKTANVRSG